MAITVTKDPAKIAAGKAGMRARWGPPRIVRLDDLDTDGRRIILALLAAARAAKEGAA